MPAASPQATLTPEPVAVGSTGAPTPAARGFAGVVWAALIAELSWAVAGVTLAMLGSFSLVLVIPTWIVVGGVLWWATRSTRDRAQAVGGRSTAWIRLAAVAVALLATFGNGMLPGEHMQTGRDGGTYTATAGWIASDGGLLIAADVPPFDEGADLSYDAAGFHEITPDGPLYAQFMHAFPAMMATVDLAGGLDLAVRTNAWIGGVALLAFYAFGERFLRPWLALVAQLALAGNLVFIYFTRAPFAELLMLGMLFGGLWALDQAVELRDRTVGVVAGLLLGATFLARLDGLVVLLMIVAALLPPLVTGRLRPVAPATLLGILAVSVLALIDLFVFAPFYVLLHVEFLVPIGLAFLLLGTVSAASRTGLGRAAVTAVLRHRAAIATATAVAIVVVGAVAYVVRPELAVSTWDRTTPIGILQQREGVPVDETRTYAEQSARWLGWYLGVPALVAGVLGWADLTRHTIARRAGRTLPFLLAFSGLTTLYVWRPSITPDHIWADRRFLPVVLPGLLLCAGWLLQRLWTRAAAARWRIPAHSALLAVALLIVLLPLQRSLPVADLREQAGMASAVAAACERLGDDAAILLLDEAGTAMHYRMTQPLRAHCGIPAAWVDETITNQRINDLVARAGDRTLYLLAARTESFQGRPVGEVFPLLMHHSVRLAPTLLTPPRTLEPYGLEVYAAPVTPTA